MTLAARTGLPRPHARRRYAAPLLRPDHARLAAFVPAVAFCALAWARTLDPARTGQMLAAAAVAAAVGAALLVLRGHARLAAPAGGIVAALLVAGVPARMLAPGGWDELLAGLGGGLGDLPTTSVPYSGTDEWTITVLVLIGALLAVLAAWLGFASRRRGPVPAAIALVVLFAVPAVQAQSAHPWAQGIALAVLLCALLRLERIERHAARAAAVAVALAGLAGALVAPRLDVGRPLVDPEALANAFAPERGLQFSWNHTYTALQWPRTGREMLRVRTTNASYWKIEDLSHFDGLRWAAAEHADPTVQEASMDATQRDWSTDIHVRLRGLTTRLFVGAGTTLEISHSPRTPIPDAPGTFRTGPRPLRAGQSYDAVVWAPRPTRRQLRTAHGSVPSWTWGYLRIDLPGTVGGPDWRPGVGGTGPEVSFPGYAIDASPFFQSTSPHAPPSDARDALLRSAYGDVYRLAERLRTGTHSPYGYVTRVLEHLRHGYTYSESPPRAEVPLVDFLLGHKEGYCQQFSGAMALLLRMGGVPARVSTGFSPGALDRDTGEYVVRDTDAHSWVEAYIAPYGWVTFDPTPPVGPARLAPSALGAAAGYQNAAPAGVLAAAERTGDRALGAGSGGGGSPLPWIVAGAVVGLPLLAVAVLALVHRRRGPAPVESDVAELCAALEGTGRTSTGGLTLQTMLRRYRGTPAEPYLRTLQAARFAGADATPTPAMRAALRRELALGLGPGARLSAWRAIPPAPIRPSGARSTYPRSG